MKNNRWTPWGHSDSSREIETGLTWHSTSSHGGYELDAEHWAELMAACPTFRSFTGPGWLEEDCDWAMAVAVWPDLYSGADCFNAVRTLLKRDDVPAEFWQVGGAGRTCWLRSEQQRESLAGMWEVGGGWGPVDGAPTLTAWGSHLRRVGTDERKDVVFADYPQKQFYTEAELEKLTLKIEKAG